MTIFKMLLDYIYCSTLLTVYMWWCVYCIGWLVHGTFGTSCADVSTKMLQMLMEFDFGFVLCLI